MVYLVFAKLSESFRQVVNATSKQPAIIKKNHANANNIISEIK